ncbi:MAG: L-threonylcarbamoyladenylate synthase [bacterium]|nr:L-threonylcarbamoyladenylate synthase [bacterium]
MESCRLNNAESIDECVKESVQILRAGGVLLYPTDTLYGLGADALSDEAVDKVYAIKGRDEQKPIHAMFADLAMVEKYAEVPGMASMLAKAFLPGALTLILKKRTGVETGLARGIQTIGIRIPKSAFCLALAKEFGGPFTATSANKSGSKTERSTNTILVQLNRAEAYTSVLQKTAITNIDLVIDAEELPERQPTTVVDLSGKEPIILREGAVSPAEIWNAIRTEP